MAKPRTGTQTPNGFLEVLLGSINKWGFYEISAMGPTVVLHLVFGVSYGVAVDKSRRSGRDRLVGNLYCHDTDEIGWLSPLVTGPFLYRTPPLPSKKFFV